MPYLRCVHIDLGGEWVEQDAVRTPTAESGCLLLPCFATSQQQVPQVIHLRGYTVSGVGSIMACGRTVPGNGMPVVPLLHPVLVAALGTS